MSVYVMEQETVVDARPTTMSGADVLAALLEDAGITVVAGIPGHTIGDFALAVGAREGLRPILLRHEATGAFAADVYFRVSGRLMAVFTHAFPGAANALTGVANAYADFSSLFWVTGNTASVGIGRGGYQELSRQIDDDLTQVIRPAVKRVWQPRTAEDLAHNALAALRESRAGRPGPVALNVSQEVWSQTVDVTGGARPDLERFVFADDRPRPDSRRVADAAELLRGARRPAILAGNGVNLGRARDHLRAFSRRFGIPVATTASGKGGFPESDALSVGVAGWVGTGTGNFTTANADVLLVLGARLGEPTASSWVDGATFGSDTKIVQFDIDAGAIANAYPVEVPVIGHLVSALEDLTAVLGDERLDVSAWLEEIQSAREAWTSVALESQDPGMDGRIGTGAVVQAMRRAFSGPVNLVNDCGKHHKWIVQQFEAGDDDYIVSSMGGASMGIGLAGAIGAQLGRPEARTIAWLGDGGMSMSLSALPTVAEYRLPITTVVIDDASYGVVHNTQMAQAGRTAFADFDGSGSNPDYRLDFRAVAEGCGIPARTVSDPSELDAAFAWAAEQEGPTLITVLSEKGSTHPGGGGVLRPLHDRSRRLAWRAVSGE
ncbi:thiamine pyrophosphate-binding protein [Microbacterium aoyamense]|uniref:Thiamine pyrophosphate-binding protein n=1 Tax=Microbacterium aoyamense TaxID=344166 RepID=A0ABN2PT70_9MICO|nr:thiamine pyrophosphate-binding protein [Microbacterium aoyamense]